MKFGMFWKCMINWITKKEKSVIRSIFKSQNKQKKIRMEARGLSPRLPTSNPLGQGCGQLILISMSFFRSSRSSSRFSWPNFSMNSRSERVYTRSDHFALLIIAVISWFLARLAVKRFVNLFATLRDSWISSPPYGSYSDKLTLSGLVQSGGGASAPRSRLRRWW